MKVKEKTVHSLKLPPSKLIIPTISLKMHPQTMHHWTQHQMLNQSNKMIKMRG